METIITFFPVDCGDMTLIALGDKAKTTILIDCNIRAAADDSSDSTRDVAGDLRDRLNRDMNGRPYVDAFLLSHPDQDHCRGIRNHLYLGDPAEYPDDKKADSEKRIFIRELWSSPMVFRRASKNHSLSEDAKAINSEAKRRVSANRDSKFVGVGEGNRILILGEDEDGKTDQMGAILVRTDEIFTRVNGFASNLFSARLLAPLPKFDDDEVEEETLSKNHSSVVLNIELAENESRRVLKNLLSGGDAEVAIWEQLWEKHEESPEVLQYDILQTPHHCSWHSLSYDSWSEKRNEGKVSESAKAALSQIRPNGIIVATSGPIKDDDNDPPCYGAKREYEEIVKTVGGTFRCTGEYPTADAPSPLEFKVSGGMILEIVREFRRRAPAILTSGIIDAIGARGAEREPVRKEGTRRYA